MIIYIDRRQFVLTRGTRSESFARELFQLRARLRCLRGERCSVSDLRAEIEVLVAEMRAVRTLFFEARLQEAGRQLHPVFSAIIAQCFPALSR